MAAEVVTAITINELAVGGVTAIDVRGRCIAVANLGGTYDAFLSLLQLVGSRRD